jgi:phenylpropionate dioxygenase-like ring-hydroxylating dioxygenase large terminal subunit
MRARIFVRLDSTENDRKVRMKTSENSEGSGYIRDRWYAVALARDIGRKPVQEWLLDEPIVLFRKTTDEVSVLRDRCPHRHAPLSMGTVIGDEIQCRYHGFQFDSTGRCTKIPGEKVIPGAVRVQVLPALESLGCVWVWGGDPAKADPALLPKFPLFDKPGFISRHIQRLFEVPFSLIVDNLMDLTHVHFVHSILGVDNLVHDSEPMETWEEGDHVLYKRDLKQGKFAGMGTYMEISGEYIPPSLILTRSIPRREGSDEIPALSMSQVLHCLTPRTSRSTIYIALKSWNVLLQAHEVAAVEHQMSVTLAEDKEIIEAQYKNRCAAPGKLDETLVRADRAAVMARRVYNRVLGNEAQTTAGSA